MKNETREAKLSELTDKYKCDVIDFVIIEKGCAYFSAIILDKDNSIEVSDCPSMSFIYEADNLVSDEGGEGNDFITSSDLMWYMTANEGKGWDENKAMSTLLELEGYRFVIVFHDGLFELVTKKKLMRYAMDGIISVSNDTL